MTLKNRMQIHIEADVPDGVTRAQLRRYIKEALATWGGGDNLSELERLRTIANELGAQLSQGPLACKKCGMREGSDTHVPVELCPRVLEGYTCRESDQHHKFQPGDPL